MLDTSRPVASQDHHVSANLFKYRSHSKPIYTIVDDDDAANDPDSTTTAKIITPKEDGIAMSVARLGGALSVAFGALITIILIIAMVSTSLAFPELGISHVSAALIGCLAGAIWGYSTHRKPQKSRHR